MPDLLNIITFALSCREFIIDEQEYLLVSDRTPLSYRKNLNSPQIQT